MVCFDNTCNFENNGEIFNWFERNNTFHSFSDFEHGVIDIFVTGTVYCFMGIALFDCF